MAGRGARGKRPLPGESYGGGGGSQGIVGLLRFLQEPNPIDYGDVRPNESFGKAPGDVPYNLKLDPSLYTQQRFTGNKGVPSGESRRASNAFSSEEAFLNADQARDIALKRTETDEAIRQAKDILANIVAQQPAYTLGQQGIVSTPDIVAGRQGEERARSGRAISESKLGESTAEHKRFQENFTAEDVAKQKQAEAKLSRGEAELRASNFAKPEFQNLFTGAQAATTGRPIADINKLLESNLSLGETQFNRPFTPLTDQFRSLSPYRGATYEESPAMQTIKLPNGQTLQYPSDKMQRRIVPGNQDVVPSEYEKFRSSTQGSSGPPFTPRGTGNNPLSSGIVPSILNRGTGDVLSQLNLNLKQPPPVATPTAPQGAPTNTSLITSPNVIKGLDALETSMGGLAGLLGRLPDKDRSEILGYLANLDLGGLFAYLDRLYKGQ